ncbi:MAG: cbb3-type cytochrome c oxidase subunit 3 [Alphaproteobacteria bacterium]|nr:cbb3-type cytochrome c oxidase subunit 3 [Alphaproteobacteria bacterium]MCB1551189.1 cbb3-type cytochrome c oxidase subunit 3 [Alphaproteobacteria bacterium]MCB9985401.1 cbb3-type cytochrome c oxidase subunit 3 [Micavibrio sp.]HPQ50378.1 cbb3-type cytochrome c oxidase subunit 3 [Alphaproteobacteria bacterium]HRK98178.1 cbb3-type cytochrome c oxidase subunit 3 [Alphaproteobacteria bacterium]
MGWIILYAPLIGLLFFVAFFAVMTVWLYRPKSKQQFDAFANIPFEDDLKEARDE